MGIDLMFAGFLMVLIAFGMCYVVSICLIFSQLIDALSEWELGDLLFWLMALMFIGGFGVFIVGIVI